MKTMGAKIAENKVLALHITTIQSKYEKNCLPQIDSSEITSITQAYQI